MSDLAVTIPVPATRLGIIIYHWPVAENMGQTYQIAQWQLKRALIDLAEMLADMDGEIELTSTTSTDTFPSSIVYKFVDKSGRVRASLSVLS